MPPLKHILASLFDPWLQLNSHIPSLQMRTLYASASLIRLHYLSKWLIKHDSAFSKLIFFFKGKADCFITYPNYADQLKKKNSVQDH